jgi:hypothetical protein
MAQGTNVDIPTLRTPRCNAFSTVLSIFVSCFGLLLHDVKLAIAMNAAITAMHTTVDLLFIRFLLP